MCACTPGHIHEQGRGGDEDATRARATLGAPTMPGRMVGAILGGPQARKQVLLTQLKVQAGMRAHLALVRDPAVQSQLARHCVGESKIQYRMRAHGSDLRDLELHADYVMDATLTRVTTGPGGDGRANGRPRHEAGEAGCCTSRVGTQAYGTPPD